MPKLNSSASGDWILIAASVGVVAGIIFLIVDLAFTQYGRGQDQPDHDINAAIVSRRVYAGEDAGEDPGENPAEVTKQRQSELRQFVEQNCPACHGMRTTSGIGPALSGVNLQHLSVGAVSFTILYGRPAKGMPGWEAQLSENDAYWIAMHLKSGG